MKKPEAAARPGADAAALATLTPEMREAAAFLFGPRAFGERLLRNRDGSARVYRDYQAADLACPARRVAHLDGRAVGKTINLSTLLLWHTFVHHGRSVLVAAPYQGQLDMIIGEVEFQLDHSEVLRSNVATGPRGRLKIKRHPYFEVEFANGCTAYFRPAGDRGDAFRSLHVDVLLVDEAAWLPEAAWRALGQCLNAGGLFRVYSTPNGLRDTSYYKFTQSKRWRVFRWPSWLAPDWSPEREQEMAEFYGGKDTPGYQHEVAGEHGAPSYGAFNARDVVAAVTDLPDCRKVCIDGDALAGCVKEAEVRARLEMLLNAHGGHGRYWLGGDLGYTSDPTELVLLEEDDDGVLSVVLRVHAEHVAYTAISELIGLVDSIYSPEGIGIDRGGNGTAVEHELIHLDKFRDHYLRGRLVGYDFGGTTQVGEDEAGRPIRKRFKEHMTTLINRALHERKLRLPSQDADFENQLCTQTYVLGDRGIVYSKGNDHLVDALRCALMRRAQETDPSTDPVEIIGSFIPVLTAPIFD